MELTVKSTICLTFPSLVQRVMYTRTALVDYKANLGIDLRSCLYITLKVT